MVIVLVIIGVLGSVAAMRIGSAGSNADEVAVDATIVTLLKAIEHYAVEHQGKYPKVSTMKAQLTQYSDLQGNTSPVKTNQFSYGPYLRNMPKNLLVFNPARDEDSNSSSGDDIVELEFNVSTGKLSVIKLKGRLHNREVGQRLVDAKFAASLASLGL